MFSAFLLAAAPAQAFWGLAIDPYPMPDPADETSSFMQNAGDLSNNGSKLKNQVENEVNKVRSMVAGLLSGDLNTLTDMTTVSDAMKPVDPCMYLGKIYKNTSADDIYDLVKILLLQYPGPGVVETQAYDGYREQFYQDTIVEIHTAAEQLQARIDNEIKPNIEATIKCIKGESSACGTPSPDGNNDAIFVEGKAFEALDNLYTVLLNITALKAQLAAAQALHEATPARYVQGVENQTADTSDSETGADTTAAQPQTNAAASPLQKVYASATVHRAEPLAFAQLGLAQTSRSAVSALSKVESAAVIPDKNTRDEVDNVFTFVTLPESPVAHAYSYEEDKMAELEKLAPLDEAVSKAREVHNTIHGLSDYKNAAESMEEMRQKYEKALKSLKVADACAKAYLGRHFSNPAAVWGGKTDVTNHDARSGISGWAFQAYETAKAAQTIETSTGDIVAANIDADEVDLDNPTDTKKNLALIQKQGNISPGKSKEEKAAAEARETRMLSWQVGAEASKMLAAAPEKWGKPSAAPAFPVWQDVKSFYNQYLDRKYANIKSYLKTVSPNDVLAVVVQRLNGTTANVEDTLRRQKTKALEQQLDNELSAADDAGRQAEDGFDASYQSGLAALQKKRAAVVAKQDEAAATLKELSDELSDLRNQAQDEAGEEMSRVYTEKEAFPSSWSGSASGNTVIAKPKDFEATKEEFDTKSADNKSSLGIDKLSQQVDAQKKIVSSFDAQIAAVDAEIKAFRLKAQGGVSEAKMKALEAKDGLLGKAAEILGNADASYGRDVKKALIAALQSTPLKKTGLMAVPEVIAGQLESSAANALENLYALMEQRVDQARAQMAALGDNLYNPEYHDEVVQIHQRMINDIKALSVSVSASGLAPISGIQVYTGLLTADTSAEEEDYFVGSTAKARDLKAPMVVFVENLPPLREMFHFDETDFQNVKPFVAGNTKTSSIINSDFLNVGGEIPKVWQYMLRRHAYVEADINLREALSAGCPQVAFMRGGFMPCKVKDSAMVIDMDANGNYIRARVSGSLPECPYLEARSGGLYHTFREVSLNLAQSEDAAEPNCSYSELGTLFEADETNNLYFRQPTYDVYYALLKELNDNSSEPGTAEKRRLAAYDRMPMAFNQIGEFLVYAENESTMRDQLKELEEQYNTMMDKLFSLLREYGYEPSASLNLAKESDYNLVRGKLDNIKNQAISEALSQIAAIDVADNDVVAERVTSQQKVINALQKDKDEMTIISGAVEDKNDLDEEIKTSKVNEDVAGKFIDSLNKASASVKLPEAPYCASY